MKRCAMSLEAEIKSGGLERGRLRYFPVVPGRLEFTARLRIDTPKELDYYQHGGILHYVLRQLAASKKAA